MLLLIATTLLLVWIVGIYLGFLGGLMHIALVLAILVFGYDLLVKRRR